jgi:hypothetical protein
MKPNIKIPSRFAAKLQVSKSPVVRWNQGKRKLSHTMAMQIVDLFAEEGVNISILALRPDLKLLKPYLCQADEQRKL